MNPRPSSTRHWRKPSRSSGGGGSNCVEVSAQKEVVSIRDSKISTGQFPYLAVGPEAWQAFVDSLKAT
ncbi:uncharacterized protein DUF397 [Stackebrandtia endophytica]|uniref:Uncharacterized protein DUF397 n=1 Tax=Stackebrandtia endophytica TaxID=1496996 RepID=A0A543AVZ2_9ACTN|nr:uncharacterized protein DUF397 [Stackebrandtia endophytica]